MKLYCPICRERPATSPHHVRPLSEGGTNERRNVSDLCKLCHDIVEDIYNQTGMELCPWLVRYIRREYGFTGKGQIAKNEGGQPFRREQPFGAGYHKPVPTLDALTGLEYSSRKALGRMLAPEHDLDPTYPYVYYVLRRMFPGRFVNVEAQN